MINNFYITKIFSNTVTDNASNIVKSFTFPGFQSFHQSDSESESDSDSETDLENDDTASGSEPSEEEPFRHLPPHDSCYAYTLQLIVNDGMKEIGSIHSLMSKVSALVYTLVSERMQLISFGINGGYRHQVPQDRIQKLMIRSVLQIHQNKLDQLDFGEVHKLSLDERNCLQDLCDIFVPAKSPNKGSYIIV